MTAPWTRDEFEAKLRERGRSYHIHHPFNVMLNTGKATPEQIRGWVANRFYYQIAIPIKDAAVMSNCTDREVRRGWIQRILDHDGFEIGGIKDPGGIEAWLRLGEAVGLTREEIESVNALFGLVEYAYIVNGHEYRSRQIRLGVDSPGQSSDAATQAAARYPEGREIEVFYDPSNPGSAALETPRRPAWYLLVIAGLCFGVAAYAGVWGS